MAMKLSQAAKQNVLGSPLGAIQYRCDFNYRCTVVVAQYNRLPLSGIKMKQGIPEKLPPLVVYEVGVLAGGNFG